MTCEWVEEQLSAYHDGMLDATISEQVRAHLATCARCSAILADYARFDNAIAHLPRYAPAPELRSRIFDSPAFREILRGGASDAPSGPATPQIPTPSARLMPQAARVWLTVLALIVVVSGGTFAIQRILADRDSGPIYAACPQALSAGPRLVYRNDDHLFSNSDKLVCESRTQVSSLWQVSPDGKWIAYIDTTTNTLRLVGSNAIGDHQVDAGASNIVALNWSPDGQTLLIVKRSGVDGNSLAVSRAGALDHSPTLLAESVGTQLEHAPVFSPDRQSVAVAFGTPDGRGHEIMVLGVHQSYAQNTSAVAQENTGLITTTAAVSDLAWTNGANVFLTWRDANGTLSSVSRSDITQQTKATVLAQNTVMATFSQTNGTWAAANSTGIVSQLDVSTHQQTQFIQLGPVTSLAWSPDGTHIAAVSNGTLWVVSATGAVKAGAIDAGSIPAWATGSIHVAYESAGNAQLFDLITSKNYPFQAKGVGSITGMAWSPDGFSLAIWGSQGVAIDDRGGTTVSTLSGAPAEPPQWSQV